MTYTLNFIGKFGLWELQVNRFHARFYRTRDEAMKCVTRYRRMLQSEQDRYENQGRFLKAQTAEKVNILRRK